jgi:hypothetical protein
MGWGGPLTRILLCKHAVIRTPSCTTAAAAADAEDGFSVELDLVPTLVPLLSGCSSTAVQEMAAFALARLAQVPDYQAAVAQVGAQGVMVWCVC